MCSLPPFNKDVKSTFGCLYIRLLRFTSPQYTCEGLSKISINFTLHLSKVGKLKRFKKVSSDLKIILNLRFLSFEKGKACESILIIIMLRGKIGLSKPEVKKIGCVWSFLLLEEFKLYLSWNISQLNTLFHLTLCD